MSRKVKNILMITFLVILIGISIFTIYYRSMDYDRFDMMENSMNQPRISNENIQEDNNMEDKLEKNTDTDANFDSSNNDQIPEIPNDLDKDDAIKDNNKQFMNNQNQVISLKMIYYIFFTCQSFGISLLIMYLIMSNFNKKALKETFKSSDKIIIYILSTIIITISLTLFTSYITKKITVTKASNTFSNQIDNENNLSYSSAKEITEDTEISDGEYKSSYEDENVILVTGNIKATFSNITVLKTGDSSDSDNASFYGINSAIIGKDGAYLTLNNITVETNATGANGVFSYGGSATTNNTTSDYTTITINNSSITTTKDNSGGIMTTGGGIMNANNLTINTSGTSSAAIRSDRGGGAVIVDGGTYTTTGQGSPTIYSTANIAVSNATLISKISEGIIIEGRNSVSIDNCKLTASNTKLNGQSTTYKNIFLYQSMSGDAADGNATFTALNSQITTNNGDSFYVTNTTATINLENNIIINNDLNSNFLRVQADSWGNTGSNGGNVDLILTNQNVVGNIVVDEISSLNIEMKSNSYYEGIINGSNESEVIKLTLDKNSKIKLTGNSYITSLTNEDLTNSNIDFNGYKLYVNLVSIN